jgi:pimeloyl-ACP methyl ester carboxylesterase
VGTIPDAAYLLSTFAKRLQLTKATVSALVERFQFTRSLGDVDIRDRFSGLKNPVNVPTLFVHDQDDARVPHTASEQLRAAHGPSSRLLITRDYGHSAVLAAGEAIDSIVDFLAENSDVAEQKATLKPAQIVGQQGLVAEGAESL